jgi:hypothetical protein
VAGSYEYGYEPPGFVITPWSRVHLEKPIVAQLVKKFPTILWNPKIHYRVLNNPSPRPCITFINKLLFCSEELLALRPTLKLEDHPFSVGCDCLY